MDCRGDFEAGSSKKGVSFLWASKSKPGPLRFLLFLSLPFLG